MIAIRSSSRVDDSDLHAVVGDLQVLLEDDFPVLYTGVNKYGTWIIGLSVDEDFDRGIGRFVHICVSSDDYRTFRDRDVTLRDLILRASFLFVIDKYATRKRSAVHLLAPSALPKNYLPSNESYCPRPRGSASLEYETSLRGGIADESKADPEDVNEVALIVSKVLLDSARAPGLRERIYERPSAAGSFRLRFNISVERLQQELFNEYPLFIRQYIAFCLSQLHRELPQIDRNDLGKTPAFHELLDTYRRVFGSAQGEPLDTLLVRVRRTAGRLLNISGLGRNFDRIEFFNVAGVGSDWIGTLNSSAMESLSDAVETYDQRHHEVISESGLYSILIHHLNAETRRGTAYIVGKDSVALTEFARVRITVRGTTPLEETKFTESLYKNKQIQVRATAKKIDGVFRALEIDFD